MSFALLIIGITLIVAAVRGTHTLLIGLLKSDFQGPNSFLFWIVALLAVGAIGYFEKLKGLSNGLLALIILVLILARGNPKNPGGGFFQQLTAALKMQGSVTGTPSNISGTVPRGGTVGVTIPPIVITA